MAGHAVEDLDLIGVQTFVYAGYPRVAKRTTSKPAARKRQASPETSARSLRVLAGVGLIVVATCLAYFPSLRGGFILDDSALLTDNPFIKAADGLYRFWFTTESYDYWPVSNTTLWIEWRLWGMQSIGYHVTNLVLHLAEALLIWRIVWCLSIPGAFLAALLFAVHPVNVETVAWIAQRKSLLAMLFFLLAILWYLKAEVQSPPHSRHPPPGAARWYRLSLLAFVLAMLSKGSVAILPLILLGIVWWLRALTWRDLVRMAPFFVVAVVLAWVNVWFQTHGIQTHIRTASLTERLLGAGAVVWFYLYKAMLPVNLIFIYPQWHIHADQLRWWLPLLAAVAATGVLWWNRRGWSRPLLFAWGYFCVALVPVLGFTDVGFMKQSLVADHYQHLALIGVTTLVAAGWGTWQERARGPARWVPTAVAVAMGSVLAVLTWQQNRLYVNAMTLYQATLERNPESSMAHNNLGTELSQAGRVPEAIGHFEQALRLEPDYPDAHNNLGNTLRDSGRLQEAIDHYEQALRLQPDFTDAHNNLGVALAQAGQLQEAIGHYRQALRLKPDYPQAYNNLGNALADTGELQEAIDQYRQALQLKPDYPEAHYNLGNARAKAGQLQEAIVHYQQVLQLKSDYPDIHYKLGIVLAQAGQSGEAIEHFRQALQRKPDSPNAQYNIGIALAQGGQLQEAIDHLEQALRLKPDFPEAHYNLGNALAQADQLQAAIGHFQQALRLKPDYADAAHNLEIALAIQQKAAEGVGAIEDSPPP